MQKVTRSRKRICAEVSGHQGMMEEDALQISLYGQTDVQVSWQLQQMNSVLEATNSSLRQQLHLKMTQLGQREEDLQGSRRELAQSQEALQEEQRVRQETGERLQACQSDREKTKEALQREEVQRKILEQRLNSMQDTLKPLFTCLPSGICSGRR